MSYYICPHGDSECTKGYHTCSECLERFERKLTLRESNYDTWAKARRWGSVDDYSPGEVSGCSCHINPPCSWCTRDIEEECETEAAA